MAGNRHRSTHPNQVGEEPSEERIGEQKTVLAPEPDLSRAPRLGQLRGHLYLRPAQGWP